MAERRSRSPLPRWRNGPTLQEVPTPRPASSSRRLHGHEEVAYEWFHSSADPLEEFRKCWDILEDARKAAKDPNDRDITLTSREMDTAIAHAKTVWEENHQSEQTKYQLSHVISSGRQEKKERRDLKKMGFTTWFFQLCGGKDEVGKALLWYGLTLDNATLLVKGFDEWTTWKKKKQPHNKRNNEAAYHELAQRVGIARA